MIIQIQKSFNRSKDENTNTTGKLFEFQLPYRFQATIVCDNIHELFNKSITITVINDEMIAKVNNN